MKVPLTGGPKDTTPASITSTVPPSGTASYNGNTVVFAFDDYVDRSARNAISVLPNARFTTSYAGDEIEVAFPDPLDANTTYTVTLGTEWTDLRGNKPTAAHTIVFSTGAVIDTGHISGYVRAGAAQNLFFFCYQNADTLSDTFSPRVLSPKYRLPIGTDGTFSLRGLSDGRYRVLVVRDDNRNGLLDNTEDFVVAPADVVVQNGQSEPLSLLLGPAIDKESPTLLRANALSARRLSVMFSEPVRPLTTWEQGINIEYAGSVLGARGVIAEGAFTDNVVICTEQELDTGRVAITLRPSSVQDSAGNSSPDSVVRVTLRGTARADTVRFGIWKVTPADSARGIATGAPFVVRFTDAVDTNTPRITLWHTSASGAIKVAARWLDLRTLSIQPLAQRAPRTWYSMEIGLAEVRSLMGSVSPDTTLKLAIETEERRSDPGAMRGIVADPYSVAANSAPLTLRVLNSKSTVVAQRTVRLNEPFEIDDLAPETYTFDVYVDGNANSSYDYGGHTPFSAGEQWWPIATTVMIRSRWTVDDVRLEIGTKAVLK